MEKVWWCGLGRRRQIALETGAWLLSLKNMVGQSLGLNQYLVGRDLALSYGLRSVLIT